jgi:spermidine synthase
VEKIYNKSYFLGACFVFSGATSLTFEVLWFRQLGLLLGSSHLASAYLLTLLMLGFALGSWSACFLKVSPQNALRVYGQLELFIGLYSLAVLAFLYSFPLDPFYPFRWWIGGFVILPPAWAMGATLPCVLDSLFREQSQQSSRLYALNTLGAVLGIFWTGFFGLPLFGLRLNWLIASLLSSSLGIFLILFSRFYNPSNSAFFRSLETVTPSLTPSDLPLKEEGAPKGRVVWLLFYFCIGFIALSYQTFWTRALILILGSSTYAFSLVLLSFLLLTALGAFIFSYTPWQGKQVLGVLQIFGAAGGLFALYYLTALPHFVFTYFNFFPKTWLYFAQFLLSLVLMAPTCLALGATFPALLTLFPSSHRVASLYSANTLGGAIGPFLLGLLFVRVFRISETLLFITAFHFLLGLCCFWWRMRLLLLSTLLFVPLIGLPQWDPQGMTSKNYLYLQVHQDPYFKNWEQLEYREGWNGVVTVDQQKNYSGFSKVLRINGKEASGLGDLPTEILLAHLPFAFLPQAEEALLIGFGGGITAGSTLLHPLKKLVCVELSAEVLQMEPHFREINLSPLAHPSFTSLIEDGRAYLNRMKEPVDIILSQPSNPWITGAAGLFTQEFYELGKKKLKPQGVFCQWLQTYEISFESLAVLLKAFHQVFPEMLVLHPRGKADLILLGFQTPLLYQPEKLFESLLRTQDLERAGIREVADLTNSFILLPLGFAEKFQGFAYNNTDDNGWVEFHTPYELFTSSYLENNQKLHQQRSPLVSLIRHPEEYLRCYQNALSHGEFSLALYWIFVALQDGAPANDWAAPELALFYNRGSLPALPSESAVLFSSIQKSYTAYHEALHAFSAKDWKQAEVLLESAIRFWVRNREAHFQLALMYQARNQKEEALKRFELIYALGRATPEIRQSILELLRKLAWETSLKKNWGKTLQYLEHYQTLDTLEGPLNALYLRAKTQQELEKK